MNSQMFDKLIGPDRGRELYELLTREFPNERSRVQRIMYYYRLLDGNINGIRTSVTEGRISPDSLIRLGLGEINPKLSSKVEEIKSDKFNKEMNTNIVKPTTDMFRCRKCKENKCTYYEQQTRCADEPMTKFIKCCNCKFEWRI